MENPHKDYTGHEDYYGHPYQTPDVDGSYNFNITWPSCCPYLLPCGAEPCQKLGYCPSYPFMRFDNGSVTCDWGTNDNKGLDEE